MEFTEFWKLIPFIELCKINKLVMHLNSCSMDLGRDTSSLGNSNKLAQIVKNIHSMPVVLIKVRKKEEGDL